MACRSPACAIDPLTPGLCRVGRQTRRNLVFSGFLWFSLVFSGFLWFSLVFSGFLWFSREQFTDASVVVPSFAAVGRRARKPHSIIRTRPSVRARFGSTLQQSSPPVARPTPLGHQPETRVL